MLRLTGGGSQRCLSKRGLAIKSLYSRNSSTRGQLKRFYGDPGFAGRASDQTDEARGPVLRGLVGIQRLFCRARRDQLESFHGRLPEKWLNYCRGNRCRGNMVNIRQSRPCLSGKSPLPPCNLSPLRLETEPWQRTLGQGA